MFITNKKGNISYELTALIFYNSHISLLGLKDFCLELVLKKLQFYVKI